MSYRIAEPLPECGMCENPMLRETHTRNGGLCDGCTRGIDATVRMLPPGTVADLGRARRQRLLHASGRPPLVEGAETVFVERYIPPVPHEHGDLCDCAPMGER